MASIRPTLALTLTLLDTLCSQPLHLPTVTLLLSLTTILPQRPSNIALNLQLASTPRIALDVAFLDLVMDAEGASMILYGIWELRVSSLQYLLTRLVRGNYRIFVCFVRFWSLHIIPVSLKQVKFNTISSPLTLC